VFGPKNVQAKFVWGLGLIVLLLGVFFASSLHFHLSSLLESQVRDRADLVFRQVSSVQQYVRETLRPTLYKELPDGEFIIEAMSSSYISRAIMDRLNMPHAEYHYRRVAENARNPLFEINADEKELLTYFRTQPGKKYWQGYRKVEGKEFFLKARPVIFKESCLTCHGNPEDSPSVLLERYGTQRGFGHIKDQVAGLVVVGVPVEGAISKIRNATKGYVALYGLGMLFFFGLIQIFFNRLITTNLQRLTNKFRTLFQKDAELGTLEKLDNVDEIEEMVQGLEELGDHIHEIHNQLRQHSENLEYMVETRTSELKIEAEERRADVGLFVQLLDGLNKSNTRREMWRYSLPIIVKRFRARSGSFICMVASQSYYTWPENTPKPGLPDNWKEILTEFNPYFEPGKAFIPVGASQTSSEGILCLTWDEGSRISSQDRDILRALGQQLGIAMENLNALHNLLWQKDMLQAVVEGIGDPLLLMDGSGNVVLANEGARRLSESFGGSVTDEGCAALFTQNGFFESCPLQLALESGTSAAREVQTEDGRFFSVNVFPVAEGTPGEGRAVVYIRDVTQDKQMLTSMQQSEKLATVGQLAAGLAHEINNPLGVIRCYAELLKGNAADQEQMRDVNVIINHAAQAENVLQDLLNFARPKKTVPVMLDIGQAMENALSVFRVQAEKKGVKLESIIDGSLPAILANEQAVEQIFANLLKNALDAVPQDKGRITVSAHFEPGEESIRICVADNGPGISKKHRKKLFDPFFSTKEVGMGTGLGLAVVYGLVQELGGTITIENTGGAMFVIVLPVTRGEQNGGTV
jgi:signal transduction histidine kinase